VALDPRARLGPYEIVSLVGAGGMGEIYKATDTRLNRTVAIKILTSTLAVDPGVCERFDREARIVSQVDHPHICALYDIGTHEGTTYLVMPYLDGETLAARLQRGALALDSALRIGIEILDALNAAHHAGITHRDLKPANIMLTKSGVKLLDFGVAKLRPQIALAGAPPDAQTSTQPTPLTKAGTFVGTLHYMSPEQLEGHEGDPKSDIFAFGAVLYEMLTGRKAFEGTSQASVIAAIMERDVGRMNGDVAPPAIERIVRKCLAKDPEERWQTAKDLGDELRWVREAGASAIGTAARDARAPDDLAAGGSKRARRRRFIFRLTIGISVSAVIAVGLLAPRVFAPVDLPTPPPGGTTTQTDVELERPTVVGAIAPASPRVAAPRASVAFAPSSAEAETARLLTGYISEVVMPCRATIEGRYPFGTGSEIQPADFGRVFGYDGLFEKFFAERVTPLLEPPKLSPADAPARRILRAGINAPPEMMPQFDRASEIRRMFFPSGERMPLLMATAVKLSNVDPATTRFVFGFNGQRIEAGPGEEVEHQLSWTGAAAESYVAFENRVAQPETRRFEGPWSLFRLLDTAEAVPQTSRARGTAVLRVATANHRAQLTIQTAGSNPFASRAWRQFKCEP